MYSGGRDPFKFLNAMEMVRSSMNIFGSSSSYTSVSIVFLVSSSK